VRIWIGSLVVCSVLPSSFERENTNKYVSTKYFDRLCGLVVRVLGYRSGDLG
jgi:hypothetical protein